MQIIILGGFLGSGKTTLLLKLARFLTGDKLAEKPRVIILENEIGEVGVDDQLLKSGGYRVENLFSGCACCSMAGEVVSSVQQIRRDFDPEWLIIESTGVAYPKLIRENLMQAFDIKPYIFALVDAKRWKRLLIPMTPLLSGQLADADTIFVNKIDLVSPEQLEATIASVRSFNSTGKILPVCAAETVEDSFFSQIFEEV